MRNFQKPGRSAILSNNGMVASSHPLSSSVGLDILKRGGNAVDAAIAMALVLPLCEPQSTGYFGDIFCIISQPNKDKYIGINGSGKSANKENAKTLKFFRNLNHRLRFCYKRNFFACQKEGRGIFLLKRSTHSLFDLDPSVTLLDDNSARHHSLAWCGAAFLFLPEWVRGYGIEGWNALAAD